MTILRAVCVRLYVFAVAALACPEVPGDTIYLKNGDTITGTVVSIKDGTVTFKHPDLGELKIKQDAVQSIATENPVAIKLDDETIVEAPLRVEDRVQGMEKEDEDFAPVAVEEIQALAENKEALLPKPPTEWERWSGYVEAGATWRSGNTDTFDATLSAGTTRKGVGNTLELRFFSAYSESEGELDTRRFGGEAKWQHYPFENKFYTFLTGRGERDDGRKLDYRIQAGGGVGYDFFDTDRLHLSGEAGVVYTWEQWALFTPEEKDDRKNEIRSEAFGRLQTVLLNIISAGTFPSGANVSALWDTIRDIRDPLRDLEPRREEFPSARLALSYSQNIFDDSTLSDDLVVLPNLEDLGEYQLRNEFSFATALTQALQLRFTVRSEFDSMADESDVDEWDHTLITSLRYAF